MADLELHLEPWDDRGPELERRGNIPEMTVYLGGPESEESILDRHRRILDNVATGTGRMSLASSDGRHKWAHAYPKLDNAPSNGVCRKAGFELLGEADFEYPKGNPIVCNDWRYDLARSPGRVPPAVGRSSAALGDDGGSSPRDPLAQRNTTLNSHLTGDSAL